VLNSCGCKEGEGLGGGIGGRHLGGGIGLGLQPSSSVSQSRTVL
jgi:hypothetical protein